MGPVGAETRATMEHGNLLTWLHWGKGCSCEPCSSPPRALQPGCSVIVCTYNRAVSLSRFLASLQEHDTKPDQLVIVDASTNDDTEQMMRMQTSLDGLAGCTIYVRVGGALRGLTRQRNFGMRLVRTDLVAFFDDDVVLLPGCLGEMIRPHRLYGDEVVGVGACDEGEPSRGRRLLWRLRLCLGIVGSLRAGSYQRSGMSIPWAFLAPADEIAEGDWLGGAACIWKTVAARKAGFYEAFGGYAQGEDLDFSLRMSRQGRLVLACAARFQHLHEASSRPDHYKLGYMAIYNRYQIHRRGLPGRSWRDVLWFIYAWSLDTLLLTRHFFVPGRSAAICQEITGRLRASYDLLRSRRTLS